MELCVNIGEFQRQLAEIDMTNVENDSQLFRLIRNEYREIRGSRAKYFFRRPVDVHFIQVSIFSSLPFDSRLSPHAQSLSIK